MLIFFPKNNLLWKSFLYFQETKLSYILGKVYSKPWDSGIFSYFRKVIFRTLAQRNIFYIWRKEYWEPWHKKTFLYFQKWSFLALFFSYISGSKKKNEKNLPWKNVLYFRKWKFLASRLEIFLNFIRGFAKPEKWKIVISLFKHKHKRKKFLILFHIKKQNFLT